MFSDACCLAFVCGPLQATMCAVKAKALRIYETKGSVWEDCAIQHLSLCDVASEQLWQDCTVEGLKDCLHWCCSLRALFSLINCLIY